MLMSLQWFQRLKKKKLWGLGSRDLDVKNEGRIITWGCPWRSRAVPALPCSHNSAGSRSSAPHGKQRQEGKRQNLLLFISVISGKREPFSTSCIKTTALAKLLEQTRPQQGVWLKLQPLELHLCQKHIDLLVNKTSLRNSLYNLQKSLIHSSKKRVLWCHQKQNKSS